MNSIEYLEGLRIDSDEKGRDNTIDFLYILKNRYESTTYNESILTQLMLLILYIGSGKFDAYYEGESFRRIDLRKGSYEIKYEI